MNTPFHSRTFKSGNSEAVRLPKGMGFGIGQEVEVERQGDNVIVRAVRSAEDAKRELSRLVADLAMIGRPDDGVQSRPDFEAPDRSAL
ncbi:MAG: AbrB/MazE/SpoVT family DNA-binding domain-containing protein [Novosphingobium sp.]